MRLFFIILILLSFPSFVFAAVSLPWETTYGCAESNQDQWLSAVPHNVGCDGLEVQAGWCAGQDGIPCPAGAKGEQITSDANNPIGGGGRGQRQWVGDGTNDVSGGTTLRFSSPQKELWIRWYLRYPEGFVWSPLNNDKLMYINCVDQAGAVVLEFAWDNSVRIVPMPAPNGIGYQADGVGWQYVMGGAIGDGKWHSYEGHIKLDTDGTNGIAQMWIDGKLVLNRYDADYGRETGYTYVCVTSNGWAPANGGLQPNDFDDIKIVGAGDPSLKDDGNGNLFIGPISTAPTDIIPPSPPSGLSVS